MVDVVKDEVVARLQRLSLTQLEEVAGTLTVDVPAGKKQKLNAWVNAIRRYLSSEDIEDKEDEGLECFNC